MAGHFPQPTSALPPPPPPANLRTNPPANNIVPIPEKRDPVVKVEVNYLDESASKDLYIGARFIMEVCKKLEAGCLTTASAAALFHEFFRNTTNKDAYDIYVSLC